MESAPHDIPRRLPRGLHGLDPGVVAASQRTRLLEAVGRAVAEKGYAAATIDDIVRGAGVSKKTFYDHFSDKLDCFLAAYEAASDELLTRLREAQATGDGWLDRTRAGVVAYLRWLAAEPALARVFLIEVAAAGPVAAERRERLRDRYAEVMRELQDDARTDIPALPRLPDEIFHALVAAVDEVVMRRIRESGGADLPDLEPVLLHLQVALLAGPQVAAEASAL
ncbi:MAG TPA: TetR/AcrR family transcriptional regulator [Thermoleophilaceae bacterium]|nr:TetR/AcrR family transcriptional regulator [Thermoleophilaceae bacterium]